MRVTTTSTLAMRWRARGPRWLVFATVGVFCLGGIRAMLRDPEASPAASPRVVATRDLEAEAFAQSFARVYLAWDGSDTPVRERRLSSMFSSALDGQAGVQIPARARQRVRWTTVAGSAPASGGRRVVLAVGTDVGVWQLSVLVARDRAGRLGVPTYPAIVGTPPSSARVDPPTLTPVTSAGLLSVARRVVTNYLQGERENLVADLAPGASVVLPDERLQVRSIGEIGWTPAPRAVRVEVVARRRDGVGLTLAYDLDVVRRAGRWLVRDLLSNPIPKERLP